MHGFWFERYFVNAQTDQFKPFKLLKMNRLMNNKQISYNNRMLILI